VAGKCTYLITRKMPLITTVNENEMKGTKFIPTKKELTSGTGQ
jgi:hypothetical protein